jgi:hypothetical protein
MNVFDPQYCKRCYRTIPPEQSFCLGCNPEQVAARNRGRAVVLLGMAGLPVLVIGVLSLDVRLCLAGGIVSGAAALLYAALSLRHG